MGAVLGEGETSEPVAVVGRSCVSVGPFRRRDEAEEAQSRYAADDMTARVRSTYGDLFVGHWVQIRDVPAGAAGEAMIRMLHDGGLADAYPIETEDEGRKISLGVFGNLERRKGLRPKPMHWDSTQRSHRVPPRARFTGWTSRCRRGAAGEIVGAALV